MQDRFKFRFFDKQKNEMMDCYSFSEFSTYAVVPDGEIAEISCRPTENCEFMQCTGLKDKNGKLIYEGDIVKMYSPWDAAGPAGYDTDTCIVKFDKTVCGFTPMCNYDCDCCIYHEAEKLEVIGNIYETPELLESN